MKVTLYVRQANAQHYLEQTSQWECSVLPVQGQSVRHEGITYKVEAVYASSFESSILPNAAVSGPRVYAVQQVQKK